MSLIDHSVLEVPSGGFSWVVEKGAACKFTVILPVVSPMMKNSVLMCCPS